MTNKLRIVRAGLWISPEPWGLRLSWTPYSIVQVNSFSKKQPDIGEVMG